jgi:hypothetical protein
MNYEEYSGIVLATYRVYSSCRKRVDWGEKMYRKKCGG